MQEPSSGVPAHSSSWQIWIQTEGIARSKEQTAGYLEAGEDGLLVTLYLSVSLSLTNTLTHTHSIRTPVISKHKRRAMCKHTQRPGERAICGTPISYYQDNLKNRRRFRFRLCPTTEREVLDAVVQRGKLEPPSRRWVLQLAANCGIRFSVGGKSHNSVRVGAEAKVQVKVKAHVPYIDRVLEDKFADKVETILKLAVKRGSIIVSLPVRPTGATPEAKQPQPSKTTGVCMGIEVSTTANAVTMDRSSDSQEAMVEKADEIGSKVWEKRKQKKKTARQGRHDAIDALVDDIWEKMCL